MDLRSLRLAVVIIASLSLVSLAPTTDTVAQDHSATSHDIATTTLRELTDPLPEPKGASFSANRNGSAVPTLVSCSGVRCHGQARSESSLGIGLPAFQPSTSSSTSPAAADLGSLAWDVAADEAVFFGGWDGHHAGNQTWVFRDGNWTNVTNPLDSPPARNGAAMAYDGQAGINAVVLVGGCSPTTGCPTEDTWTFFSDAWHNITSQVGTAPRVSNATMTTWGLNGTILYGGCTNQACSSLSNGTWTFQNSTACQSAHGSPCWTRAPVDGATPPGLAGASIAVDPTIGPQNGTVALYGGFNVSCSACRPVDSNATWLYNGAVWENITSSFSGTAYPSLGRSFASLFWDPYTAELYLYGGENVTSGSVFDQIWTTDLYTWSVNASSPASTIPLLFSPAVSPGYDRAAGSLPPMLFGGLERPTTYEDRTWIFEPSLNSTVATIPSIEGGTLDVEANVTVHFFSNTSGEFPVTSNWSTGDGGEFAGGNGSHAYRNPGHYRANLTAVDLYGVRGLSSVLVNVSLFGLAPLGPWVTDRSVPLTLSVTPVGGIPPYNCTWSFSDGTTAYGTPITRSFDSAGSVTVLVVVRDGVGTQVREAAQLQVNPDLSATAAAKPSELDVNTVTDLTASAQNGTLPYSITWVLPNEATGRGSAVSYRPTSFGNENVTVVVTDRVGGRWSSVIPLIVNPPLTFTASSSSVSTTSGRTVTFATSIHGGTSPYSYAWRFGDGSSSPTASPTHTYSTFGIFTVAVWVNDSGGGSFRQTIEVKIPRTSGGLLWQLLGLPAWESVTIVAGAILIALAIAIAIVRWRRRSDPGATRGPGPSSVPDREPPSRR